MTVEEAIARVPGWAQAADLRVEALGGGITNNNFRVDVGSESFVLRIAGADTELLGIVREYEYQANLAAGNLGIAPQVYYFIQPEGYLVTRFINGRPIPPEEISQPEYIIEVTDLLRKLHAMERIPGRFDAFQVVRSYTDVARRYQVDFPKQFDWVHDQILETQRALSFQASQPKPCHNDLLNANFLANSQLYLLDWEYAGMGDVFFDLANFCDHHELSDAQVRWLLKCYLDREATPAEWAHTQIMKVMSELREASWGLVQIGISQLDFDFREYADKFFDRALTNLKNPNWTDYLKEVSKNV